jgi:aspartyl-tRNA(Asn)/glutamyl-tRNA(Gln) amidotransferase subunit B
MAQPTIGLEIHAELKTRTKMFCDSLNDPEEKHPNVNVCPVCLGHPGTLPVPNREAIAHVVVTGLALKSNINNVTKFDRKNYFYPDLPKGYQISQYDEPLVAGGVLNGVRIRRIHLEEDTGTLIHARGASLVDFNRAGVPLMELVTEPDLHSADDATAFARELQLILRYLGVSDANMEKGEMRIEANVSLDMGTKVELKNINSFKAVHDAVAYELTRQGEALARGEKLAQETRGWDEASGKTVAQRSKEEAHDYRYFPEPDIPPFETGVLDIETLRDALPELPAQKRARFMAEYGLPQNQLDLLIAEPDLANFFEETISELKELDAAALKAHSSAVVNYLTGDLRGLMNDAGIGFDGLKITPEHLAHLVFLTARGAVTSRQAKDLLGKMFATGEDPEEIVKNENIGVVTDEGEVEAVVLAVIAENKAAADDYKKGKTASLQFLIGKAMGKLKGRARPEMLKDLLERNLRP